MLVDAIPPPPKKKKKKNFVSFVTHVLTQVLTLLTTTQVQFLVLKYSAWHCPGRRLPVPGRAPAAGMVPSVQIFPSSITVKLHHSDSWTKCPDFCLDSEEMDYSAIFGFKTALFTVIIIVKSPPSTATRSKIV